MHCSRANHANTIEASHWKVVLQLLLRCVFFLGIRMLCECMKRNRFASIYVSHDMKRGGHSLCEMLSFLRIQFRSSRGHQRICGAGKVPILYQFLLQMLTLHFEVALVQWLDVSLAGATPREGGSC